MDESNFYLIMKTQLIYNLILILLITNKEKIII